MSCHVSLFSTSLHRFFFKFTFTFHSCYFACSFYGALHILTSFCVCVAVLFLSLSLRPQILLSFPFDSFVSTLPFVFLDFLSFSFCNLDYSCCSFLLLCVSLHFLVFLVRVPWFRSLVSLVFLCIFLLLFCVFSVSAVFCHSFSFLPLL